MPGLAITEAQFSEQGLQLASIFRWRTAHFRPALTKKGWRTPVAGDGKGFLDLLMIKPPRIVVAELKSARGKLTPEQEEWLADWRACPGAEAFVWKPDQLDEVTGVLSGKLIRPGEALHDHVAEGAHRMGMNL
jgi:hypothetical protein